MSEMVFKSCPKCGRHSDNVGHTYSFSDRGAWYTCGFQLCQEVTPIGEILMSDAEKACTGIAEAIGEALPEDMGYMLMVFPFGKDGEIAYMSNADRDDMVSMLRHQADHLEKVKG